MLSFPCTDEARAVTWRQLDVLSNVAGLFQSAGLRIGTGGRELADAGLIVSPFGSNRVKIWVTPNLFTFEGPRRSLRP